MKVACKPQTPNGSSNEIPLKSIKSFGKVELKNESLLLPILKGEGVDDFLRNHNVR